MCLVVSFININLIRSIFNRLQSAAFLFHYFLILIFIMKKSKVSSPLRQLTLNFGAKSSNLVQKTIECNDCGMIYNLNDKNDEHLHKKYHAEKDNPI